MGIRRRDFVMLSGASAIAAATAARDGRAAASRSAGEVDPARAIEPRAAVVNDVHSQLNRTTVARLARPSSVDELRSAIETARALQKPISVSGGRHAMGGQQFGTDTVLLDTRAMNRVLGFDAERGILDVEAGIEWPRLMAYLAAAQEGREAAWGIIQKQTGADRLTLGGALASNVHGRGLALKPLVDNVESFVLMDHTGALRRCSRLENAELFRLVIGGYGLFGIVTSVRLRLWRRRKVRRVVELTTLEDVVPAFERRIADGCLYGDFQFATDSERESFLTRGVFSCYRPVDASTPVTENPTRFRPADWARLTYWAHRNKRLAFDVYSKRYLATSGQIYWSDSQLSAAYIDDYHRTVDRRLRATVKGTEMITEIYVPRGALVSFMEDARRSLREHESNVIYGTVRLIEKDEESFLRWAKQSYACVIFNLHVDHTRGGLAGAAASFRALIDLAIRYDGSFYLTYHRFATRRQLEACYPQFAEFLALKRKYDPGELFQSDWYRHHKGMVAS